MALGTGSFIKAKKVFKKLLRPPRKYSFKDTILVVGTGRSGTTWLIEAMNAGSDYRIVFEPFHHKHAEGLKGAETSKPYLDQSDKPEHEEVYKALLLGDVDNRWINRIRSSNPRAKRQIIKEIRLNKMLAWIQHNFTDLKIVIIVRDPYSTAFSSTEMGWLSKSEIDQIMPKPDFANKHFTKQQITELKKAKTTFQRNMVSWTIENYMLLKDTRRSKNVTSVYYEALVNDPEAELRRIAQFCGHTYKQVESTKKSQTAQAESVVNPKSKKFGRRWEGSITKSDMRYANNILKIFGLDVLYKERNIPAFAEPLDCQPGLSRDSQQQRR